MKTELLAEKTALVMQNKNGGFRDLYGSLSTVHWDTEAKVFRAALGIYAYQPIQPISCLLTMD